MPETICSDERELRSYLENVNLGDYRGLESMSGRIMAHVRAVMFPYANNGNGEHRAFAAAQVESAYRNRDFLERFPKSLGLLISSIE